MTHVIAERVSFIPKYPDFQVVPSNIHKYPALRVGINRGHSAIYECALDEHFENRVKGLDNYFVSLYKLNVNEKGSSALYMAFLVQLGCI